MLVGACCVLGVALCFGLRVCCLVCYVLFWVGLFGGLVFICGAWLWVGLMCWMVCEAAFCCWFWFGFGVEFVVLLFYGGLLLLCTMLCVM